MKVAILAPSYGPAFRKHERCLTDLRRSTFWPLLPLDGYPSIQIARAILAEKAIEHDFDMTLWLDSDVTFTVESCIELVNESERRQAIVGGLYLGKAFGAPVMANFKPETTAIDAFEGGGVIEVLDVGFGAVAVPTKIFVGVKEKLGMRPLLTNDLGRYTPWFSTDLEGEFFHSADYAFTERARRAGYQVFVDTRHRFGHLGEYEFQLEDALGAPPRARSLKIPLVQRQNRE